MEFQGKYKKGGFDFSNARDRILKHCDFNVGKRFIISDLLPESKKQRRYLHGAVISLWAYLDGNDYQNGDVLEKYYDYAKHEFNPEVITINQKLITIGGSTKGKLNNGFIEKIIDYLQENYAIEPSKCLDPKLYKKYKDEIYPNDLEMKYETYIDYLLEIQAIPLHK